VDFVVLWPSAQAKVEASLIYISEIMFKEMQNP
jgi:hypothetical protein